ALPAGTDPSPPALRYRWRNRDHSPSRQKGRRNSGERQGYSYRAKQIVQPGRGGCVSKGNSDAAEGKNGWKKVSPGRMVSSYETYPAFPAATDGGSHSASRLRSGYRLSGAAYPRLLPRSGAAEPGRGSQRAQWRSAARYVA